MSARLPEPEFHFNDEIYFILSVFRGNLRRHRWIPDPKVQIGDIDMKKAAVSVVASICMMIASCGTVTDDIHINTVTPSAGSTSGGNEVLLVGRGFLADSTVTFGDENAVVVSIESTRIKVIAPPADQTGSVKITLADPDGVETTKSSGYTYRSMLYVANKGSNEIVAFDFDSSTSKISELSLTSAGGGFPIGLAHDSRTQTLYAAHSATISEFTYSFEDGSLVALRDPVSAEATGVNELAFDATNRILFTSNFGSSTVSSFISDDETGGLSFVEVDGVDGFNPYDVAIDDGGKFLFLANNTTNDIAAFTYSSGGELEKVASSPFGDGVSQPVALAVDREYDLLFCVNFDSNDLTVFSYGDDGALRRERVINSHGTRPRDIILDTSRKIIFVANQNVAGGTIRSFTYDEGGNVSDTGFSMNSGGERARALAISTANRVLFVANEGSNTVSVMTYDSEGKMTSVQSGIGVGGFTPSGLIFIP
jgi:6-phosphogluconolactonase (cycloisomerase 2 family)